MSLSALCFPDGGTWHANFSLSDSLSSYVCPSVSSDKLLVKFAAQTGHTFQTFSFFLKKQSLFDIQAEVSYSSVKHLAPFVQ